MQNEIPNVLANTIRSVEILELKRENDKTTKAMPIRTEKK